jgi:CCR4-NOT transcription complex subunit 6
MSNGYLYAPGGNRGVGNGGPGIAPNQPHLLYGKSSGPNQLMSATHSLQGGQMMYNVLQQGGMSLSQQTGSIGPHHIKQLEGAQRARLAGTQAHHHARVAASQQRLSNNLGGGTISASSFSVSNGISSNTIGVTLGQSQQHHLSHNSLNSEVNGNIPTLKPTNTVESSSWTALDMGGMMINQLHPGLFAYKFLTALYLNHNNLTSIPPIISELQRLTILNLTGNKLTSLPVELGLVVSLKELLLYDNQLTFIPPEYGQLYQLEMLGLEGNPVNEPIASMIIEKGTNVVIKYLRDSCPCKYLLNSSF